MKLYCIVFKEFYVDIQCTLFVLIFARISNSNTYIIHYFTIGFDYFQGIAAHVSPFTSVQDLGNLLNRAGFTMLTLVSVFVIGPSFHFIFWGSK